MARQSLGAMREWLLIQKSDPAVLSVSSLVRSGAVATMTTAVPHGYATGDYVLPAGATPTGYNARVKITVTGPTTFTFAASSGLATPATGTITVTYVSDSQGGRRSNWVTVGTIPAEMMPKGGGESLGPAQAIAAVIDYRFRVRSDARLTEKMRALWTPSWQAAGSAQQELEIHAIEPFEDGRTWMVLNVGRAA